MVKVRTTENARETAKIAVGFAWFIVALTSFLCFSINASATVFVAVKTPDGYVVGGDSLRGMVGAGNEKSCKIFHYRDTLVVVYGFMGGEIKGLPRKQTDLHAMSLAILKSHGSSVQKRDRLLKKVNSNLDFMVGLNEYTTFKWVGAAFIDPKSVHAFRITEGPGGKTVIPGTNPPLRESVRITDDAEKIGQSFGENSAAQTFLDSQGLKTPQTVDQAAFIVKEALKRQASATPASVGGPFTIVHVTKPVVTNIEAGVCISDIEYPAN